MFDQASYGVDPESGLVDYDNVARLAQEVRPLILVAGYSAYPRRLDFARLAQIAADVNATFMVDMAQGLIVARSLGIDRALLVCDDNNVGSATVIEKHGGVLEWTGPLEDGHIVRHYWIN